MGLVLAGGLLLLTGSAQATPDGYAVADAGSAAGAEWLHETASEATEVVAFGSTGVSADTGGPSAGTGAFVDAFTVRCEADHMVAREAWSDAAGYSDTPLTTAQIDSSAPLDGAIYDVPGCDDPNWDQEVDTDLGALAGTSVHATITGQGDESPYLDTAHFSNLPDCVLAAADGGVERDATAQLTTTNLGPAGFDLSAIKLDGAGLSAGADGFGVTFDDGCGEQDVAGVAARAARAHRLMRAVAGR